MNMKTSEYLEIFECSQRKELSPKTVNRKIYEVSKFFEYLDKQGIQSLENFDIRHVYDYLNSLYYASQTVSCIQFTLREFFDVMYKHDISDVDGRHIFPVIFTNKRDRILSYYNIDEIRDVISQIDKNVFRQNNTSFDIENTKEKAGKFPAVRWTRVFRPAQVAILLPLLYVTYTSKIPICQDLLKANSGIAIFSYKECRQPLSDTPIKKDKYIISRQFESVKF